MKNKVYRMICPVCNSGHSIYLNEYGEMENNKGTFKALAQGVTVNLEGKAVDLNGFICLKCGVQFYRINRDEINAKIIKNHANIRITEL